MSDVNSQNTASSGNTPCKSGIKALGFRIAFEIVAKTAVAFGGYEAGTYITQDKDPSIRLERNWDQQHYYAVTEPALTAEY